MAKSRNRINGEGGWNSAGSVATTSGTTADFTSIPDWVTEIKLVLDQVSLSGIDQLLVQLGDAGGIEATSYQGNGVRFLNASTPVIGSDTTGLQIRVNSASYEIIGEAIFNLTDAANTWVGTFAGYFNSSTAGQSTTSKALSATLTQVRLTPTGSDTFDDGRVTLFYR